MDNKIGVIGEYDSIYGFAALGLTTFPVSDSESAVKALKNMAATGYGIIYITESMALKAGKQIDKYREQMTPAIILIPGVTNNTGEGIRAVHRSVEQAVGSDVLNK